MRRCHRLHFRITAGLLAAGQSYRSGTSDAPLIGLTIGQQLERTVTRFGTNTAVQSIHQNVSLTYEALHDMSKECARSLLAVGVSKGDRVAILAPSRVEWLAVQFATAQVGAILVTINPSYRENELRYALHFCGCKCLVTVLNFKSADIGHMLRRIVPNIFQNSGPHGHCHTSNEHVSQLEHVVVLDQAAETGNVDNGKLLTWQQFLEVGRDSVGRLGTDGLLSALGKTLDPDDPINIQYTSGTTGAPKGATLSHHNILNNGFFVGQLMGLTEKDRLVLPVPLFHCFGMVMGNLSCMTSGAAVIYPSEAFHPRRVLEAVGQTKATALFGVPTMFIDMLSDPLFDQFNMTSLRTGVMAGSQCPREVLRQVKEKMHMRDVQVCYGMTETSPVSMQTRLGTTNEKQLSTVGQVHPHVEVKIVDKDGAIVPEGVVGELCTRGYSVMKGYWGAQAATEKTIDKNGWLHSGDLAAMDSEGYVSICGRKKDMIIRGGENIFPKEIEELLLLHPALKDAYVCGVPDSRLGEEVGVWLRPKNTTDLSDLISDILKFCDKNLALFKVPRYVRVVESYPMTVSGKIQKYKMSEETFELVQRGSLRKWRKSDSIWVES
jgi:fatty-acyl-CoA synthase